MENTTPFADAVEHNTSAHQSQIDILRESNRLMKLEIIQLKQALSAINAVLTKLNEQ